MGEIVDLKDKVKRYYRFTKSELTGLTFSIIIIAFIFSFRGWGATEFNARLGLTTFFNAILIVALAYLAHDAGQRIWALVIGYRIEYRAWTYGLVAALFLAFLTNGYVWWFIIPSNFIIHHLAGHRLGWFRYDINYFGQAMVALAGPLSTLSLMFLLKIINVFIANELITKAILFNLAFTITSMLPFPPLDGSKIYFGSRMLYAFTLPFIVADSLLLVLNIGIIIAISLSLLIGLTLWIAYYVAIEKNVWYGPR